MEQRPDILSNNNNQQPRPPAGPFVQKTLGQAELQPPLAAMPAAKRPGFFGENRFYILAILAGIVIIAALSFLAFRKTPVAAPKEANINISIDAPQTAPAGGQAVFKIKADNQDSQKLVGLSLELDYGSGMTFAGSSPNPQNLSGTLFSVPDLLSGQNAVVIVKTQVSGNVNDLENLGVKLHYRYGNFNSEFIKRQAASIRLTASDISVDLTGPTTTNNAQIAVYTIRYQNNSQNAVSGARLRLNYPDGFSFAAATPPPDSGNNIWSVVALAPGNSGSITIQGAFNSANPGESKTVGADFQILGQDGQYFTQNSGSFTTQLASLPLLVSQELNVSRGGNGIVNPGDSLNFSVRYQNNASVVATGVNILVTLNSKALDLSSLQAEGAQINNNTILWDASASPNLESLNPSDSGQLSFSARVKNPATKDSSKNLTITSSIKIKSREYDSYFPGNDVNLKIASPVRLVSSLAYQSGQLPPQVGKATLYSVNLILTNATNDFTDGVLTAFVPLGAGGFVAGSVNSAEAGNVQFDPATDKLSWQVGPLLAHSGQFSSPRTLQFGVRVIPSSSQIGSTPTLVKGISFSATDTFTSQTVSASVDDLTTASTGDYQNGAVQQ